MNMIGKRFKKVREESKFTQAQVANFLGIDQSLISKFEKDERNINVELLEKACALFGCPIECLINDNEIFHPMSIAFRTTRFRNEDLEAIAAINKIALNMKFMNSLLKESESSHYLKRMSSKKNKSQIELNSNALKIRRRFNEDANSPIDIFAIVNNLENFTLVFYPMTDSISGMCIREEESNFVVVNSNLSLGRQRFTVAHELYHLLFDNGFNRAICETDLTAKNSNDEKEADIFASYLLVPYDALKQYVDENYMPKKETWELEDVIRVEQFFQISHQAMLHRFVQDGYINWDDYLRLKPGVKAKAIRMGYSDQLYSPTQEEKKYFSLGEYIWKVELLSEKGIISDGKYDELLLNAYREDIVYNLGSEECSVYD